VSTGWLGLADAAVRHRLYNLAEEYIDRGVTYCSEHGIDIYGMYLLALRARVELDRGRLPQAAETAAHVLRERITSTFPRTSALVVLALVRARRGDPGAARLLGEAHNLANPTGELLRIYPVAAAQAEVSWLRGESADVEATTEEALELAIRVQYAPAVGELRMWRRRAGIRETVEDGLPDPYAAELAGNWEQAAAYWDARGCAYDAALARASASGAGALRRVHDELQRLGARPAAAIVARTLRERGVRGLSRGPRRGTRASPAGLTQRETEVLALVVEGLSNAEIATRLFLSTRTVDHHVSAILRKLEVPTRARASAEASRLGLLPV
jgi:ATP/maltotriose-dependent transcriptional regulator MalT